MAIGCQDELRGHSLLGVCFGNKELGHCMCELYPFIKIRAVLNVLYRADKSVEDLQHHVAICVFVNKQLTLEILN